MKEQARVEAEVKSFEDLLTESLGSAIISNFSISQETREALLKLPVIPDKVKLFKSKVPEFAKEEEPAHKQPLGSPKIL